MSYVSYRSQPMVAMGGLTVSAEEIRDLDAKIRELDSDISKTPDPKMTDSNDLSEINKSIVRMLFWSGFKNNEWKLGFFGKWQSWFLQHQTFLSQTGSAVASEFEEFQARYNELLRRFVKDFEGKTNVAPSKSEGPLADLTSFVKWGLILGAIGVTAYVVVNSGVLASAPRRRIA